MDLLQKYKRIRACTEKICAPLTTEDYVPQPALFVSPPKWHLAHSSWFYEQFVLKSHCQKYEEFHPNYSFLFNSYYNTVGKRVLRADRGSITRPGVEEVYQYRAHVDVNMVFYLREDPPAEVKTIIELGLNHEQQHQELLLTDIKYILGCNPINPVYHPDLKWESAKNDSEGFIEIPEGKYEIGYSGNDFCFDNELARHKVYLNAYEISNALVTNGEYLAFMEAGGYSDFRYWLDEGWQWVNEKHVDSPLYWQMVDGKWHQFTLSGLKPVYNDAILTHVSYFEAMAFAEWKKMRLPTESEWEAAAEMFSWGKRWEWTNSAYLAYPGFSKAEGAIGEYNGKFMINQMVLRGQSCATAEGHSRKSYRNFFHPEERWQFNGIRLVK